MVLPFLLQYLDIIFINHVQMSISSFAVSMVPFKMYSSLAGEGAMASSLARWSPERAISVTALAVSVVIVLCSWARQLPQ